MEEGGESLWYTIIFTPWKGIKKKTKLNGGR
jgi:hypothetical protein